MSILYKNYLKEREGLEVVETYQGFATYKFRGADCYIQDIYVLPEYRKFGVASHLADEIAELAKKAGINVLTGSVDTRAESAETSAKVLTAYGMKPYVKEGFVAYYAKEIV